MKVNIESPDTIQFCVQAEREDPLYGRCMWARVTFDNRSWSMMAQSDSGDYSYTWRPEEGRTFLELMTQIDGQYLLSKIADMTQFDEESTKSTLINWVLEDECSKRIIREINDITASNPHEFMSEIKEIDGLEEYTDLWECIDHDYPKSAKTFCEVFTTVIQPEIKRYLSQ